MTTSDSAPTSALPKTAVPLGIADPVASARAELKAALAAIEVKGNFPRRIEKASARAAVKARRFADRNPVGAIAAAVGIAAVVGSAVWVIARAVSR
ncbi:hypothetical protein RS84_01381 [Microbacterium hydrocarbonoxydans]|jgi:hypothetical protein|uniref:DUF3618 domain-containing protein n=1 Tax=Microbacterium hydrocarbonoxydans TaxID=273678 RepID=A0A0M2HTH2_9MICO|nr:hypothetical protein [Microbacterium hydrocarbonoxydans]KJL47753.1 hypothetical protein RS84_01381 [Microbacterium hydrocarbonoxydans]